jgi:hypothetical protein
MSRRKSLAKLSIHGETLEPRLILAGDLIAHWRAEELVAAVPDGAAVTSWKDSVAASDAVASGTPVLSHQAIGGRPALRFDATDGGVDGFRVRAANSPMRGATNFTIAVVFATSSNQLVGTNGPWFENSGLVDSNTLGFSQDWGLSINSQGAISAGMGAGFQQSPTTVYSSTSGLNNGQFHLAVFTRAGSTLSVSVDGAAPATATNASAEPRAPLDMVIGMLQNGMRGFVGDIGQVRMYNGALNATEISSLNTEINTYYSNSAPVAVNDSYSLNEDDSFFLIAASTGVLRNDTDANGDPLTASVVSTTQNGQLTLNLDGSFFYIPARDFFGTDSFTYTANDFRPSAPATVTLQVQSRYDAPVAVDDAYFSTPSQMLTVSAQQGLLANDRNPDGVTLTATVDRNVANGSLTLRPNGSFDYNPSGFAGRTSFTYRVSDGTATSAPATVSLRINSPPVANEDSYAIDEDGNLNIPANAGILANDRDNESDPIVPTIVSNVSNGTLALNDNGSLTYLPNPNYSGTDEFTYTVSDGLDVSNTATVRIQVRPVNDPPVGLVDSYLIDVSSPSSISAGQGVLANDTDIDSPTSRNTDLQSGWFVHISLDGVNSGRGLLYLSRVRFPGQQ